MASARELMASTVSAQNQMAFQERMSSSAHQSEVKDLQAAGLNPVLSAKLGGASTPSGAEGDYSDPTTGALMEAFKTAQMAIGTSGKSISDAAHTLEEAAKAGYSGAKNLLSSDIVSSASPILDFVLGRQDAGLLSGALYDVANLVTVKPEGVMNRLFGKKNNLFAGADAKNGIPLGDFINAVVQGFSDASRSDRKANGKKWDSNYKNQRTWEILRSAAKGNPALYRGLVKAGLNANNPGNHASSGSYLYSQRHIGKQGWKNDRSNAYARRSSN